jgi:hypothetical protein
VQNWKITVAPVFSNTPNILRDDDFPASLNSTMHETFTAELQNQCEGTEDNNQKPKNKRTQGRIICRKVTLEKKKNLNVI